MATKVKCNVENVRKLADALEAGRIRLDRRKVGFNMNRWLDHYNQLDWRGKSYKTVACIGGSAELLFKMHAEEALGLSPQQAHRLFYPNTVRCFWRYISPAAATEALRYLASDGKINWPRAIKLHPLVEA